MVQPVLPDIFPPRIVQELPPPTPHRDIDLAMTIEVGRLRKCAVVGKEIQQRTPFDEEVDSNGSSTRLRMHVAFPTIAVISVNTAVALHTASHTT